MEKTSRYVLIPESGGQEVSSFRNSFLRDNIQAHKNFYWAPKGKGGIVGLTWFEGNERVELRYYPPGETTSSRNMEFVDQNAQIMFSPAGKYISYTVRLESESKFWAVENYLPAKK